MAICADSGAVNAGDICSELSSGKNTVLLDEAGKKADHLEFDAGEIQPSNMNKDFIFSKKKYYLILSPKNRTLENSCSMSECIEVKKVASSCGKANKYLISIGVNPKKYGPGMFRSEFEFKIKDQDWQDSNRQGFSFLETITGSLAVPWITPVNSAHLSITALSLFKSAPTEVEVSLKNTGVIAYKFGIWSSESEQNKDYELIAGNCDSVSLSPNTSCSVTIRKLNNTAPNADILEWLNTSQEERIGIRFQVEKINASKAATNVYNLE